MLSGPSGSSSHFGAFAMIPGEASGRMSVKAKAPALPAEAPAAGPSLSKTTTERPRACAAMAADSPTTPAPMTTTSGESGAFIMTSVGCCEELLQVGILGRVEQLLRRRDLRQDTLVE